MGGGIRVVVERDGGGKENPKSCHNFKFIYPTPFQFISPCGLKEDGGLSFQ